MTKGTSKAVSRWPLAVSQQPPAASRQPLTALAPEWHTVKRILIIRLDNIGDLVLLTPALRTLKENLPQAELTLMASGAGPQVAPLLPWIDHLMVERVVWQSLGGFEVDAAATQSTLVPRLHAQSFDAALIFTSFSQSPYPPAFICYLAGIPIRLGQSKEFGGELLTQWVKPLPDETHQAERNLHLLEAAGFTVTNRQLELHIPAAVHYGADQLLEEVGIKTGEPFIALAPGASCAARRYDPHRFADVAEKLYAAANYPIVLIGSPREQELVRPLLTQPGVRSLVGCTTLPEMAAIVLRARLLLGNDSGPMHIADACRTPMVILYSGTEYESQWGPRQTPATLLRQPTLCSPCYAFTCPYQMECLDIAPEKVVAAALEQLHTVSEQRGDTAIFSPSRPFAPAPRLFKESS